MISYSKALQGSTVADLGTWYNEPSATTNEWARDGDDGKLYIVQARPETVASQKKVGVIEEYKMLEKGRDRNHTFWDQSGSTNSDKKSGKKTLETYLYTKLSYCY